MSVLAISGSGIPDRTHPAILSRDYSPSASSLQTLDLPLGSGAAPQIQPLSQPNKKAYKSTARSRPENLSSIPAHAHSRTISSSAVPSPLLRSLNQPSGQGALPSSHSRQSSAASYTMSNMGIQRQPTGASMNSVNLVNLPHRTASGRSTATNSPTSYVALMRKQKATVWCERTQYVDSRQQAQLRAAKHRAHLEVKGSPHSGSAGRTPTASSGGVVGKIRHGGVPKAPGYVPANLSGAGVPLRLSANEMMGDEEEDRSFVSGDNSMVHGRSGSGKSSTNSAQYRSGYPRAEAGRFSTASTPPTAEGSPSAADRIPEETPNSTEDAVKSDYFATRERKPSEEEDAFGELKDMAGPSAVKQAVVQAKKAEDLRRRGSVDERTMTMGTTVKLFVANPDTDSD